MVKKKGKYLLQAELWVDVNFEIFKTNIVLKSKCVINRDLGQNYTHLWITFFPGQTHTTVWIQCHAKYRLWDPHAMLDSSCSSFLI